MQKFVDWTSDNGKWMVVPVEKNSHLSSINIKEKVKTNLWHIHLVRILNIHGEKTIDLQNNSHSKRIPQYVKEKAMSLIY